MLFLRANLEYLKTTIKWELLKATGVDSIPLLVLGDPAYPPTDAK